MKTTIAVIILLIIGVGVYYFINSDRTSKDYLNENPEVQNQQELENEVERDEDVNVEEACESALIRMTFADGESASKFVTECKEGKHPEIVEQYRTELKVEATLEM